MGINRVCWAWKGTGMKRDWHQKVFWASIGMGINRDRHQKGLASMGSGIKRDSWHQVGRASIGTGIKRASLASIGTGINEVGINRAGINRLASIGGSSYIDIVRFISRCVKDRHPKTDTNLTPANLANEAGHFQIVNFLCNDAIDFTTQVDETDSSLKVKEDSTIRMRLSRMMSRPNSKKPEPIDRNSYTGLQQLFFEASLWLLHTFE